MKLMICICSEFLCAEKTFDNKPCKSTLRCAERLKAPGVDTDRVRQAARVSVVKKEIGINQTNENTLSHFDTNVRKLYFLG